MISGADGNGDGDNDAVICFSVFFSSFHIFQPAMVVLSVC